MHFFSLAGHTKNQRWFSSAFFVFPFTLFFSCTTGKAEDPLLAQQRYQEAVKYDSLNLKQEKYASLKEAIQLDPLDPNYPLTLGASYFADGDLENAEKEFLKVLQMNESYSDAHRRLGRLYMQQRKWEKAINHLKKSFNGPGVSSPHQVYNWLALSHYAQDDFDSAEKEWMNALRIRENPSIRLNLAMAYRDRERFDLALNSLRKALLLDPNLIEAHYQTALLLLKKKDLEGAKKYFQKVIQRQPKSELAKISERYIKLIQRGN